MIEWPYHAQASQSHNDITKIYSKPSQSCRKKILSETKEKMSRLGLISKHKQRLRHVRNSFNEQVKLENLHFYYLAHRLIMLKETKPEQYRSYM